MNSIPQDITIFVDEYEKIFNDEHKSDMLTIMDGAYTSPFRRFFILTTNYLRVDENLLDRPSRVRYLKKFEDLPLNVIKEVVEDCLTEKEFTMETIDFISKLKKITIDIVKSIISEVNIQCESPFDFGDVFNVELNDDKIKAYLINEGEEMLIFNNVSMNFRGVEFTTRDIGRNLEISNMYLGEITNVFGSDLLEVKTFPDDEGNRKVMQIRIARSFSTHLSYDAIGDNNRRYTHPEFLKSIFGDKSGNTSELKMTTTWSEDFSEDISEDYIN